jgi:hypothetical protein
MTQTIINLGTAGALLNGQNGSTASADTNDALFLDWPGDNAGNYVYLPGVVGNNLDAPDEAGLSITDDFDLQAHVAADSYVTGSAQMIVAKSGAAASSANYRFSISATGALVLLVGDGSTSYTATSTTTLAFAAGSDTWVRVLRERTAGTVKFFTSSDGVTWTQLGSTITGFFSGAATANANTLRMSGIGTVNMFAAKYYRVRVYSGDSTSGGTLVIDGDASVISSGSATSLTATTGQTVTINRSTAGRKSVAVVSPVWLFGTDDFMEVADNALLDFGAANSFTYLAVVRTWATAQLGVPVMSKLNSATTDPAINFQTRTTPLMRIVLNDGTSTVNQDSTNTTLGTMHLVTAIVDRNANTVTSNVDGSIGSSSTPPSGGFVNSHAFRIASRANGGAFLDCEVVAVAVYRRALSASEVAKLSTYYQARLS